MKHRPLLYGEHLFGDLAGAMSTSQTPRLWRSKTVLEDGLVGLYPSEAQQRPDGEVRSCV
jgi:hypothetical protein